MTSERPRNYTRIGAAIVIAGVVIGAGIFASSYFATATTRTPATGTATTTTTTCSPTSDLAAPRNFAFNVAVNFTGQWEATVKGYSGNGETANGSAVAATLAFINCYSGNGVGLFYLSDWNQGGQATLQVVAQKTTPGSGNLSISMTYGGSNSMTQKNSTSLPDGSATITATILGNIAIASTSSLATSVTSENQFYDVTFQQIGACSPAVYTAPWAVTLGDQTIAEPSNTTLPIPGGGYIAGPQFQSLSAIVFSVQNGVYQYTISPPGPFDRTSGSVTVNGTSVTVVVEGPVVSCTTTTH